MILSGRLKSLVLGTLTAAALPGLVGCDMNQMAANQTANLLNEAAPALDAFWDYEIAGKGTPGAIMQLEAFLSVSPDNEDLALNLAKAYVGYAVGWVENDYEIADAAADFDKADRYRQRARLIYLRARNLGRRTLRNRDEGIDAALSSDDPEVLRDYLKKYYTKKSDVAPLFWTGMAWGAAINMSLDKPDLLADAPTVKIIIERVAELDPGYFNGGAYVFLGGFESALPAALGGNPERGKEFFERGLALTKRRNHMLHIMYARTYALNARDKELYVSLLQEVLQSKDLGNDVRLNNTIARHRAERYMAHVGDIFD